MSGNAKGNATRRQLMALQREDLAALTALDDAAIDQSDAADPSAPCRPSGAGHDPPLHAPAPPKFLFKWFRSSVDQGLRPWTPKGGMPNPLLSLRGFKGR